MISILILILISISISISISILILILILFNFFEFANISPIIDKNRILATTIMGLYLYFAIPVEEKKLISIFGNDYVQYTKRVPAVFPKLY